MRKILYPLLAWPILLLAPSSQAAPAPKPAPMVLAAHPAEDAAAGIKVEMTNQPWKKVFEWLTEQTALPVCLSCMPQGGFTFVGPKGAAYTLPEIVRILNRALLKEGFILIQHERSFALVDAESA